MPIEAKISVRRRNREKITRLFQSFVANFGNEPGEKIIRHFIEQAGGSRTRIPTPGPDPLYRCSSCFRQLWRSTCQEFGRDSGRAIMNKIMVELGGCRIWVPDHEALARTERDRKIRNLYNGINCGELAPRFKLSTKQIRNIINSNEE